MGRDEDGQREYATLLASWLAHEGPLPPPITSPDRKKRREKQQAKKQVGSCVGEGNEMDNRMRRGWELQCRMQELSDTGK